MNTSDELLSKITSKEVIEKVLDKRLQPDEFDAAIDSLKKRKSVAATKINATIVSAINSTGEVNHD